MSKLLSQYWYVPVVAILCFWWMKEHDKAVLARAQVEAIADSAHQEKAAIDSMTAVDKRQDEENRILRSQLSQEQHKNAVLQQKQQETTSQLADRVRNQLSDSTKVVFDSMQASFESERQSFLAQIANQQKQLALLNGSLSSKDSLIVTLHSTITDLNSKVTHVAAIQHPGLFDKIISAIPYIAGGYLLGKVIK